MFCRYMSGSSPENAVLDTGVTRMWLAALVEPDEVRPEIRKQFEGVTRQGRHELNEAWKISDVPEEIFHRMLRHGGGMTKNTDKNTGTTRPVVIESGWGTFLLLLAKTIAIAVVVVIILKYVFKIPIAI